MTENEVIGVLLIIQMAVGFAFGWWIRGIFCLVEETKALMKKEKKEE